MFGPYCRQSPIIALIVKAEPITSWSLLLLLLLLLLFASHPSLGIGHILTDLSPFGSIGIQIRKMTLPSQLKVFLLRWKCLIINLSHAFFNQRSLVSRTPPGGLFQYAGGLYRKKISGSISVDILNTWPRYFHFM